tara:strand:- start:3755 stop:5245 length:1491 start_codon:yes stop_codon:yes gene_type:complete
MKEHKFTTIFSSEIKPLVSEEKDKYLAMASLVEVGDFIPEVNTSKNVDLLPVAFNACVINRVNKNGDVVDTDTAMAMYKDFINKPMNIEHNRDKVVGVILTAGFSEFGTDNKLTEEQAKELKGPFNITLGGVVWKVVNSKLSQIIENASDPTSDDYLKISASWELGFSEYNIIVSSEEEKNIENAEIISDIEKIQELKSSLKGFGGSGVLENGSGVYRQVINDVVPLGIGLTENPAADVVGVAVNLKPENKNIEKENKSSKTEQKGSQTEEINVSSNKELTVMDKITDIQQITDESLVAGEVKASVITDYIENQLQEASEKFVAEKQEVQEKLSAAEDAQKTIAEEFESVKKELETLKEEQRIKAAEDLFNQRMAAFDAEYDLDDDHRGILASDIKDMTEEDFEAYSKKMKVLLDKKAENKETVEAATEEVVEAEETKEEAVASVEEQDAENILESAIENAEVDKAQLPSTSEASEATLTEKYQKAFNLDNFEIDY